MASGAVERIAHYRVLKRIGRGGMGIVYRAVDERDGRLVALKVIRESETSGNEDAAHAHEARIRFDSEAEILRSLLHVNVVAFYEIGEKDGTPCLAMEYLDGVPLTTFAGRPWTETVPLLIQAAHGLEYLSSRGIVHRDLSPDNILVIERGGERIVKLLDFGVAKMFERGSGLESLTATGFFLGKVAYGSPEQLGALGGADDPRLAKRRLQPRRHLLPGPLGRTPLRGKGPGRVRRRSPERRPRADRGTSRRSAAPDGGRPSHLPDAREAPRGAARKLARDHRPARRRPARLRRDRVDADAASSGRTGPGGETARPPSSRRTVPPGRRIRRRAASREFAEAGG